MSIPISSAREAAFNTAKAKLEAILKQIAGKNTYEILEDHQSLTDVEDGLDFMFNDNTASSRINYRPGNYVSMRMARKTGSETELPKKIKARKEGKPVPQHMFQFYMENGRLTHFYIADTVAWLDYFSKNDVASYIKDVGNAFFINIPYYLIGARHFYIDENGKVKEKKYE